MAIGCRWLYFRGSHGLMDRESQVRQELLVGGVNNQHSLHLQCHDWGETLAQGTKPPTAPRAPQHWLPTAPGVCSRCVCVHYCVCALGWVTCRAQILSMGHHTWPHVTSLNHSLKMGRGSPICERVRKMIVEYFKNNVPLQRLCKSHHLQCITSSKDSEKLEKSLCVRDKAEDLCWMPVAFGPSDDTASLIGMILSLTLLNEYFQYFQGILPEITVGKHNLPCHL